MEIELQYLYTGDEPLLVPAELANFSLAGSALFDIRDTFFDTGELALRRRQRGLARNVAQPRRQLHQIATDRMPELPDKQHAIVLVEHHHAHSARVIDNIACHHRATRQLHLVAHDGPDTPAEMFDAVEEMGGKPAITDRTGPHLLRRHGQGWTLVVVTWAPLRSSAAWTRPENSGCARVGRERNSGWACVAT